MDDAPDTGLARRREQDCGALDRALERGAAPRESQPVRVEQHLDAGEALDEAGRLRGVKGPDRDPRRQRVAGSGAAREGHRLVPAVEQSLRDRAAGEPERARDGGAAHAGQRPPSANSQTPSARAIVAQTPMMSVGRRRKHFDHETPSVIDFA